MFQSLPWPQVYKSKHLGMQTVSTNICERMGRSQELSEFQRGTVVGCHLCNKSRREISSLLNIPVNCQWYYNTVEVTTGTQPLSGRPHKMMEWGQQMLRHIVRRGRQLSADGLQISSRTVRRELHGMGFHGRASASKPYISKYKAKCQMQ